MSQNLQPARGTKDLFGQEFRQFRHVTDTARRVSRCFGFEEMATPIFEFTEVFKRTLGEESDVVGKEMYTFEDRGGESITLRPEFTAGIARALISGGMANQLPLKLFTTGPVFRYERPQKGRQRQFHQVNFEIVGYAEPLADVEAIAMGWQLLGALGIQSKVTLEINSLGDVESRLRYRTALVEYLLQYQNELSEDSKRRLTSNPMRVLDSKDEGDKKVVAGAPRISQHYTETSTAFFAQVRAGLDRLGIPYRVNEKLVRGLDYYCHTAFEFTTDQLGSQNAVMAGGRYDSLIKTMGGPDTPAVGFGGGVERLLALCEQQVAAPRPIVIIPIGEKAEKEALSLAHTLRSEGFYIELGYSGNVGKRMKRADKLNAAAAVLFGDDEMAAHTVKLKDFDSGKEEAVKAAELLDRLVSYRK